MNYTVACGGYVEEIERRVMELMQAGWRPLGGICMVRHEGFYQAMTKEAGITAAQLAAWRLCNGLPVPGQAERVATELIADDPK